MSDESKDQSESNGEEKKDEKPKKVQIRDVTDEGAAKDKTLRFTKRFIMTFTSDDGDVLQGEFTIKRPNIGETARVGVIAAELRQDKPLSSIDFKTAQVHDWIATCSVCIVKAPPWWDPEAMYDEEPLKQCYLEVVAFWNSFRKGSVGK